MISTTKHISSKPLKRLKLVFDHVGALFFGQAIAKRVYVSTGAQSDPESANETLSMAELRDLDHAAISQISHIVDVVLPQEALLKRNISCPTLNHTQSRAVATLDLTRKTPFSGDEVYWGIERRRDVKLPLIQWIAKRTDITIYKRALHLRGMTVRRFLVQAPSGDVVICDFGPEVNSKSKYIRRLNSVLLAAFIGLLGFIWLFPALSERSANALQQHELTELQTRALTLRKEIEDLSKADKERADFIESVVRRPKLVDTLRQVTVALPDSVWISSFSFSPDTIVVNGETTASAAELVLRLTNSNLPYIVALSGPVARTNEGGERFELTFTSTRRAQ